MTLDMFNQEITGGKPKSKVKKPKSKVKKPKSKVKKPKAKGGSSFLGELIVPGGLLFLNQMSKNYTRSKKSKRR